MIKICSTEAIRSLLFVLIVFTNHFAAAHDAQRETERVNPPFELVDGDRVVLLGNSLIENDQQYGYIEFALTSRWPDRDITFRNLGWSGDTVFGEARSYFTTPPDAYELLIDQLTEAQPTVVFIGYGANEAFEGKTGVDRFIKGLNKLLDKIEGMGAETVLLSPVPQMSIGSPRKMLSQRNENLKLYSTAISKTASERDMSFIDLFEPMQEMDTKLGLTIDGVHLNETGYYYLAGLIEKGLGLSPRKWSVQIEVSEQEVEAAGPAISELDVNKRSITFTVDDALLPRPLPSPDPGLGDPLPVTQEDRDDLFSLIEKKLNGTVRKLKITGLKDECYTLTVDGNQVASASAMQWSKGIYITEGSSFRQAEQLNRRILEKNELFFQKYRPLNRTYLLGFRSHEQGQNAKELQFLDLFIERLEDQIFRLRRPGSSAYRLSPVK